MVLSVIKGQFLHLLCRVDYTRSQFDLNNCYFDISGYHGNVFEGLSRLTCQHPANQ